MDIKTLFGLPAHSLFVHVPLVLIPLAMIGALGLWWEPWRRRLGWATAAILVIAGIFTQLAIGSGQELKRQLDNNSALVRAHTRIAEDIRPFLLVFFIALFAFLYLEHRARVAGGGATVSMKNPLLIGTFVATLVFGAASIYWVVRIGHTGAKAVWQPKIAHESGENRTGTQESPGEDGG